MRPKIHKLVRTQFLYTLFLLAFVSCSVQPAVMMSQPDMAATDQQDGRCLPPLYPVSYPILKPEKLTFPGKDLVKLPPHPWQMVAPLPDIKGLNLGEYWQQPVVDVLQTRQVGAHSEIWVSIPLLDGTGQKYLAVFNTDSKSWKIIPEQIDKLIVDKNGSLWGTHSGYIITKDSFDKRILSKFDEKEGLFKVVVDVKDMPAGKEKNGIYYYDNVSLGEGGIFWILVPDDAIYSYDSITGKVTRRKDFPFTASDVQIAPDGSIYVFINDPRYQSGQLSYTYLVKHFFPDTNEIITTDLKAFLEPYPTAQNILIDHLGRLWLGNIAYLDENGTWNQIQRSPLFVSTIREDVADFEYKHAKILLESSDEKLWFLHRYNGMIYLDLQKGEWCWFTTYKSNIVEDADHNLWMIADGKLYKYPLKP